MLFKSVYDREELVYLEQLVNSSSIDNNASDSKRNDDNDNSNSNDSNLVCYNYSLERFFAEEKGFDTNNQKLIGLIVYEVSAIESLLKDNFDEKFGDYYNKSDLEKRSNYIVCFGLEIAVKYDILI